MTNERTCYKSFGNQTLTIKMDPGRFIYLPTKLKPIVDLDNQLHNNQIGTKSSKYHS